MRAQNRFTLVELLAVVVIIMILAGILIGGLSYASRRGDVAKTQAKLEALANALEAFKQENGYYPPCSSETDVKFKDDGGPKLVLDSDNYSMQSKKGKPFIEFQFTSSEENYTDAWDNAFKYKCPGTHNPQKYDLWSEGDGDNSDEKITNWQ